MKLVEKRSKKTGLPPGTLVHIGKQRADKVTLTVFEYSDTQYSERRLTGLEAVTPAAGTNVTWIEVSGIHQLDILERLGKQFNLHPLLLEDIANTDQRPKIDEYGTDYVPARDGSGI